MKTDIEIAQSIELQPIVDVVKKIGLEDDDLELYGKYKAKLSFDKIRDVEKNPVGNCDQPNSCWRREINHYNWTGRCFE